MMELPNHLVPWDTVKKMLLYVQRGAWDAAVNEAHSRLMIMGMDADELKADNPYQEDE